ncbi:MAG: LPXTG cell wall anchor domain-containing protein [Clostridiales bacterium]|nr:LPXTG cell wall anchor domain-containing protein [Clostridiales bacterium]
MRVTKKKKISRKRCLRTMAVMMASVTILSVNGAQTAYAGQKDSKAEISDEKTEEKVIVYLNGKSGKDGNSGESRKEAVKTFQRAAELAGDYGVIRICGLVTVAKDETWELPDDVSVRRAEDFEGPLVKVTGSLVLENIRMYTDDFTGDGEVEGAVEREKVSVPEIIVMEEPMKLGELSLKECEGDGEFVWADETFVPEKYQTECKVIFRPNDTEAVDYSEEKGWDEETETVTRVITVEVASLAPEKEEITEPEVTPETTPTPTPEATPEPTPEATPEPTQEPTPEPTPEITPTPETTPVPVPTQEPAEIPDQAPPVVPGTPETTPIPEGTEPTPEATPTPEVPEVTPSPEVPETLPEATPVPETPEAVPTPEVPEEGLTEEEKAAAYQVQSLIDSLSAEIGSMEAVQAVVNVTRQYEGLSSEQKELLPAETREKLAAVQSAAAVFNRQSNGVTIEGDFPWYIQFIVELKNEQTDASVLEAYGADTVISPYDMKLWNLMHEMEYKLNGQQVKVTMPAPDDQLFTQLIVVHYREDGSLEYITPVNNQDGTISFLTTSFSPYNVAGSKIAGSKPIIGNTDKVYGESGSGISVKPPSQKPSTKPSVTKPSGGQSTSYKKPVGTSISNWVPKTGDGQQPWLYAAMGAGALVILAGAGSVVVVKKKRKNS